MRIAVLGLGRMGVPIAQRLERAGHELAVWNRSPAPVQAFRERGIHGLERPADAWQHADLCITMLADGSAVEAVLLGEHGLASGDHEPPRGGHGPDPGEPGPEPAGGRRIVVDMSTISATTSAEMAAECERRGVALLRAPVTGNPAVVIAGNLGIIVSGPRAEFDHVADTLRDIGPNVFYVGGGDEARIVKLGLNLMIAGTTQLLAEALVLAEKHGIAREAMLEVMGGSAIGSPFVKYKTEALIADDYTSTFTSRLMDKDLALVLEAARDVELPLPLSAATGQLVQSCIAIGMGEDDFTALLPRLRRDAGLRPHTPSV